jgi:hypothetical protein
MGTGNVQRTLYFFVSTMKLLLNQPFTTSKPLNDSAAPGCDGFLDFCKRLVRMRTRGRIEDEDDEYILDF